MKALTISEITSCLWQGRFASLGRLPELRAVGITHILNVCETPSELAPEDGPFAEIAWHPLHDERRLPDDLALGALDTLHRMVCSPESVVYIHCVAGWIRSPTILWLYLLACGQDGPTVARQIRARNPSATPGLESLIDNDLLDLVRQHGRQHYLPHLRPEALVFT